jgi:hypothetical protein
MKRKCDKCSKFISSFSEHWYKTIYSGSKYSYNDVEYFCKICFKSIKIDKINSNGKRLIYPTYPNDRFYDIGVAKKKCEELERQGRFYEHP